MFDTKAWRNIFWAGFTFDPPKVYFYLYPSSLFSLVFLLPGTVPDNSLSKNPVFQFTTMCPPTTGLVRTEGVRHKWRRGHNLYTLPLPSPKEQPSVTSVVTLLSFLVQFVHLFRARVKGHWAEPH